MVLGSYSEVVVRCPIPRDAGDAYQPSIRASGFDKLIEANAAVRALVYRLDPNDSGQPGTS